MKVIVEPKVIVLQPISQLTTGSDCKDGQFAFKQVVDVKGLKAGSYLLHVRTLNATAVNVVVQTY